MYSIVSIKQFSAWWHLKNQFVHEVILNIFHNLWSETVFFIKLLIRECQTYSQKLSMMKKMLLKMGVISSEKYFYCFRILFVFSIIYYQHLHHCLIALMKLRSFDGFFGSIQVLFSLSDGRIYISYRRNNRTPNFAKIMHYLSTLYLCHFGSLFFANDKGSEALPSRRNLSTLFYTTRRFFKGNGKL